MRIETTTNLEELRKGVPFVWGKILSITDFKEYTIVEYEVNGADVAGQIAYSCYINSESLCISCDNFDEAIACCIAHKYDGRNTKAHIYFMKSIKQ